MTGVAGIGPYMKRRLQNATTMLSVVILLATTSTAQQQSRPAPLARLQSTIERITRSVNAKWGIYLKCLQTGEEITLNADDSMDTMSVIKIPLMVEVFRQIGEGKFKLEDRVTLKETEKRPGTGIIRSLDAGASLTVKDLLTLMIIVSDNSATDMLFEKVGGVEPVNRLMQSYGLNTIKATGTTDVWFKALRAEPNTLKFHMEGKTPFGLSSPRDMGRLLEKIHKGEAVSKQASEQMMQMMRGQVYNTRMPRYVSGFRLPHKTGDFMPYIGNDVGILEIPERSVVMCVFTAQHNGVGANLEDAIGRITEHVSSYFYYR
jgi:beta-lactamase class A